MDKIKDENLITEMGNPGKPQGDAGFQMLERMNTSHAEVTAWGFGFSEAEENYSVLDIGCGGGAALKKMSELVPFGQLTGIDYSEVSVQLTKETNKEDIRKGKLSVFSGSVDNLPFPDNCFNLVYTVESFYFWPSPENNLKEVLRVLKNKGKFLLIADIYNKEGLSEETLSNIRKFNLRNPTPEEFRKMFEAAGFKNIGIHTKDNTDWICIEGLK